jgi:hypothetical protein
VSNTLNDHKSVINAAAADGKIDAVEQATISRGIADAIFAKRDAEVLGTQPYDGYTQTSFEDIPKFESPRFEDLVLEQYNIPLTDYRTFYQNAAIDANKTARELRTAQDGLSEAIGTRMYYTKEGLDERWDEIGTGKETPEEKATIVAAFRTESAQHIPEAERKIAEARKNVDVLTMKHRDKKASAMRAKREYDDNKAMVGSVVYAEGIPFSYFEKSEYKNALAYNDELHLLKQDTTMSQEMKTGIMAERRLEVIRKAISHYKAGSNPSVADRIANRLNDFKYGYDEEQRDWSRERTASTAIAAGPMIASFAKAFKDAPWDTFIGGQ